MAIALTTAAEERDIDACLRLAVAVFLIETLWLQVGPFLRRFSGWFGNDLRGILALGYYDESVKRVMVPLLPHCSPGISVRAVPF